MNKLRITEIAKIIDARIEKLTDDTYVAGLQIDTRKLSNGELFFALKSEKSDGHLFINDASLKGASGAVISRLPNYLPSLNLLVVKDTRTALLRLAKWKYENWGGPVVAITGSTGKTTTKEFVASIIAKKYNVFKTPGNFNNTIGIPLSLYDLDQNHTAAILEMGMSFKGEIEQLCQIAPPDIAVITNIGSVHLCNFPSKKKLAEAKGEIIKGMKAGGTLIYNIDDEWTKRLALNSNCKKISFGNAAAADIRIVSWNIESDNLTKATIKWDNIEHNLIIEAIGKHYLYNLAAAIGVAKSLGLNYDEIIQSTSSLKPFSMRGQLIKLAKGILLLDDSYNSNPEAMESVLESLNNWEGRPKTVFILGEMLELGAVSVESHKKIGSMISSCDHVIIIGIKGNAKYLVEEASKGGANAFFFEDLSEAENFLINYIEPDSLIVVKGSRGVRLDKLVHNLRKRFARQK